VGHELLLLLLSKVVWEILSTNPNNALVTRGGERVQVPLAFTNSVVVVVVAPMEAWGTGDGPA